ncbi:MAG: hypothetical protein ACO1QS_19030, partial [Verrucomicrobiota bacterium]
PSMTPPCRKCGQPLDTPKARCRNCGTEAILDQDDTNGGWTSLAIAVPLLFSCFGVLIGFATMTGESDWFGLGKILAALIPITIGTTLSVIFYAFARWAKEPPNLFASIVAMASAAWSALVIFTYLSRAYALGNT